LWYIDPVRQFLRALSQGRVEKVPGHQAGDPTFGTVFRGTLADFFDHSQVRAVRCLIMGWKSDGPRTGKPDVVVIYGSGATLLMPAASCDKVCYFDVTHTTLRNRVESGEVGPLGGARGSLPPKAASKRLSYVDSAVLNKHKRRALRRMGWFVDANDPDDLKLVPRQAYDRILSLLAEHPFRTRPIYIPGVWGGQALKSIRGLPEAMPNCAFALEMIPQKQSVRVALGGIALEVPFPNLLWSQSEGILGERGTRRFRHYFPVTLNYDDTVEGGDLAIQVHPNGKYLRDHFHERIRRDESYYVVLAGEGARTYHGLKEHAELQTLRDRCVKAELESTPFDHDEFINSWPSTPGDLLLIPAGTVHASGRNQLVLEIDSDPAATGQEYTFHLYDYLRPDLDGAMRGIHVDHAFRVLRPYRRQAWVGEHLKQSPRLLRQGKGWSEYVLGRRRDMYYEVRRLEFDRKICDDTQGGFHLLTLVRGEKVLVSSQRFPNRQCPIKYTETVVVPAALGPYAVTNLGTGSVAMIKALLVCHG
jgi:mannose-6-phosphate isomerase